MTTNPMRRADGHRMLRILNTVMYVDSGVKSRQRAQAARDVTVGLLQIRCRCGADVDMAFLPTKGPVRWQCEPCWLAAHTSSGGGGVNCNCCVAA